MTFENRYLLNKACYNIFNGYEILLFSCWAKGDTTREIGKRFGFSRENASLEINKVIKKVKEEIKRLEMGIDIPIRRKP